LIHNTKASKKRFYIVFVSRDEEGSLKKVPIPLRYAYVFVAAAVIGMFTITGMAGSYTRMLIKTARFNELRHDQDSLRKDYAHLEKQAHEKDVQAASLGSLATEVSALYGLTTNKLAIPMGKLHLGRPGKDTNSKVAEVATAKVVDPSAVLNDDSYFKSIDTFYALRSEAMSGSTARAIAGAISTGPGFGSRIRGFDAVMGGDDVGLGIPSLWPVVGPISSSFGQREDPVTGNGEGEFHKGVDITAVIGTPIRATAAGVVKSAGMVNGYGREVIIDHGNGIETCYGHMSGFAVVGGQTVVQGQVIGYVGHSGRTTGNHVHYEVRVRNTPVNPHKYLRTTLADLGVGDGKNGG
jgi:murein DD-endopeptidase MepM/ murein hydrolase activator NlpD